MTALTLSTARLLLRPFAPDDAEALHAQWNDPDVGRWLWDGEPVSRGTVHEVIAASQMSFRERGYGMFALRLRDDPDAVVGFAASAVLDWGFDTLGLGEIAAGADAPNARSFAVMDRLSLTYWKDITLAGRPSRYHRLVAKDRKPA